MMTPEEKYTHCRIWAKKWVELFGDVGDEKNFIEHLVACLLDTLDDYEKKCAAPSKFVLPQCPICSIITDIRAIKLCDLCESRLDEIRERKERK